MDNKDRKIIRDMLQDAKDALQDNKRRAGSSITRAQLIAQVVILTELRDRLGV